MIPTTFTWLPDAGSKHTVKPAVSASKFGDGYEQRTPHGLNTMPMSWAMTFTRTRAIGMAILAFLRARKGAEAFNWTNPLGEAGVYVCRSWDLSSDIPEMMTISCTFEQVFEN